MPISHTVLLERINELVQTDFVFNMDIKLMPHSAPYTQKEAESMAYLLGKIYAQAHKVSGCCAEV